MNLIASQSSKSSLIAFALGMFLLMFALVASHAPVQADAAAPVVERTASLTLASEGVGDLP